VLTSAKGEVFILALLPQGGALLLRSRHSHRRHSARRECRPRTTQGGPFPEEVVPKRGDTLSNTTSNHTNIRRKAPMELPSEAPKSEVAPVEIAGEQQLKDVELGAKSIKLLYEIRYLLKVLISKVEKRVPSRPTITGLPTDTALHLKRVAQLRKYLRKAYSAKKMGVKLRDYSNAVSLHLKDPEVKQRITMFQNNYFVLTPTK